MLSVTGDGRKAALDIRLVLPHTERPRQNKILALVERVKRIYDTFDALKGTQLIFCDLSTPKGKGPQTPSAAAAPGVEEGEETEARAVETAEEVRQSNFVYYEIREEVVRRGVPVGEVAFIHEYQTRAARDALFAAMNEGHVRVLIGSTAKMGSGMNVQRRLIALHDLDCPWRPGDLEQRHGRILRQGNAWPTVYIFTYVTEGSFDGYMFQTIENKARFISQALAGEITARTVEDTAELVLSAAEVKAIASGNPLIVRKVQLETELARMERLRAVHLDTILALRKDRRRTEAAIAKLEVRHQLLAEAQRITHSQGGEGFTAVIASSLGSTHTRRYDKRTEAGSALTTIVEQYQAATTLERTSLARLLGSYRGLTLQIQAHSLFGRAILLCLPDGTPIDELNAQSGAGLFASADSLIRALPERRREVADIIRAKQQRTVEIDAELERLAVWEGQTAYEEAARALASINTTLTVLEAQETAPTPAPSTNSAPPSADAAAAADEAVSEETIAAVEALWNEADEVEQLISIPPAVESLAFMEQELRRQAAGNRARAAAPDTIAVELESGEAPAAPPTCVSSPRHQPPASRRLVFGQPLPAPQRRTIRTHTCLSEQGSVFSGLGTHQTPTTPATGRTQDHTLADPAAMEQRSLFD